MSGIITLTTDFGLADAYVASMKGVMLSIDPELKIIDICHTINPQNIFQAAFVLGIAYKYFPRRTVHMVVVDPGVGTDRQAIILRTSLADFVAPDNGTLSYVIQQSVNGTYKSKGKPKRVGLGPELEAVVIDKQQLYQKPTSTTFQGRDILAPVAARLSLGTPPSQLGHITNSLVMLPLSSPYQTQDGSLIGHIQHIDNFGNLITDIRADDLSQSQKAMSIEVGDQLITGLSHTYAGGKDLLALINSSGYLEIAVRGGNAATQLNSKVGDDVTVISRISCARKHSRL